MLPDGFNVKLIVIYLHLNICPGRVHGFFSLLIKLIKMSIRLCGPSPHMQTFSHIRIKNRLAHKSLFICIFHFRDFKSFSAQSTLCPWQYICHHQSIQVFITSSYLRVNSARHNVIYCSII